MLSTKNAQFLLLGTGGSVGIPVVGCTCEVCRSPSSKNKRLRPAAAIKMEDRIFLVDCGPDFRGQALAYDIPHIDGLILTHAHHDHTAGIDDLRIFSIRRGKPIPCLLSPETLREIKIRFYYLFEGKNSPSGKVTTDLELTFLNELNGAVNFEGLKIRYISYAQGGMQVNGFRFGDLAYITDIKEFNPEIFASLKGLKTLIVGALRHSASHLHFTVDDAVKFAKEVGAEKTWLTHVGHELDYDLTNDYLPETVRMGYDGLTIDFEAELEE